jgi:hypothetical protein
MLVIAQNDSRQIRTHDPRYRRHCIPSTGLAVGGGGRKCER